LKKARKYTEKRVRKALKSSKAASVDGDGEKDIEDGKDKEDTKGKSKDYGRSLWEGEVDDKGRVRSWKNRITGETRRAKKGESPNDGKGAILADDVSFSRTSLAPAERSR
jgi:SWI/SNF-related matrix-associated actin-dependent regulator of chromatin subfamily A3